MKSYMFLSFFHSFRGFSTKLKKLKSETQFIVDLLMRAITNGFLYERKVMHPVSFCAHKRTFHEKEVTSWQFHPGRNHSSMCRDGLNELL